MSGERWSAGLFLPWGLGHLPHRTINRHVHIAREDGKAVIAVVWTGIVPRVHLTEWNAHLLKNVLFLDTGTHQIGTNFFGKGFQLKTGGIVVDQSAVFYHLRGALIVVVMTKFITRADHFHPQIFIGANHMARA